MDVKHLAAAILVLIFALPIRAAVPNTSDQSAVTCDQTDYIAYRTCVHEARRHKRQLLVPAAVAANQTLVQYNVNDTTPANATVTLHCQRLNFDCRIACGSDSGCESRCPVCPLIVDQLAESGQDFRTVVLESAGGGEERFEVSG